jgi:hypothetical protein
MPLERCENWPTRWARNTTLQKGSAQIRTFPHDDGAFLPMRWKRGLRQGSCERR